MSPAEQAQARLDALAAAMEPRLAQAFRRYVAALAPDELAELLRRLEGRDIEAAVAWLVSRPAVLAAAAEIRATFAGAVQTLTQRLASDLTQRLRVRIVAPVASPSLIDAVRRWENAAFARVQADVRDGLRQTIAQELARGIGPRQVAVSLKQGVAGGLTAYDAQIIQSFRAALAEGRTGDALGRALRDKRFDRSLSGRTLTPAEIDKMVAAYRRKLVAFRSETFARTAAMQAANEGASESWRAAIAQGAVPAAQVRRFWVVARDERLCPVCAPIPGQNPRGVGLDEAFTTENGPVLLPPVHANCRCGTWVKRVDPTVRQRPAPGTEPVLRIPILTR